MHDVNNNSILTRREFLQRAAGLSLSASALALLNGCGIFPAPTPTKIPKIGYLSLESAPSDTSIGTVGAFLQGLRDLGYIEGKNIAIEYRWAEGHEERLPGLAVELVQLSVDVILASGNSPALAAKRTTSSIPIVFGVSNDPIEAGLVVSLAHPGGNVTGLSNLSPQTSAKRLELLKEAVPKATRFAVLVNPISQTGENAWEETRDAAQALGVQLQRLEVRRPDEIEAAFDAASRERAEALVLLPAQFFTINRVRIIELIAKHQLPAIYQFREYPEAGALMSYGPNLNENYRRAATYVDKILKGRKPADLPVEQPIKFDFVINLKTAKAIGLTIPQSVLAQATEVIQ